VAIEKILTERGVVMKRARHPWLWALVLGLTGCSAENEVQGPAKTPAAPATVSSGAPAATPAATTTGPDAKAPAATGTRPADAPSLEGPKTDASEENSEPVKLTDEEIARIKKLPDDEQAAALAQAVCPVSGHHLGFMGIPAKTTALGRTIYLCCSGCEDDVKADPQAIIAKLQKK
jgi:Cu(I)/Ag(I) efflux system membrane fusion protein